MSREDTKPSEIELKAYAKINPFRYMCYLEGGRLSRYKVIVQVSNIFDV